MPLHADQYPASRKVGQAIQRAGEMGYLTTTNISAATGLASLTAAITAGSAHADQQPIKNRMNQWLQVGADDGSLTTAAIQASTTVASLAALTEVDDSQTAGGPVD